MGAFADPELTTFVEGLRAAPAPLNAELGAEECRRRYDAGIAELPPGPELLHVADLVIPRSVAARLYRPLDSATPLLVYLHGGGWVVGGLHSHDRVCRRLAASAEVAVLAVDYRLAPENVFPAAVDDAVAAVRWALASAYELVGSSVVGVGGDSAGAHVATLACHRLRDAGEPLPRIQALAYPNTDLTLSSVSAREKADGWGLRTADAAWFAEQWVPGSDRSDPQVSPLFADLHNLPPAIVVSCEHDPLRDEAEAYAGRLAAAGVPVTSWREQGMIHGFLNRDKTSPAAHEASQRWFRAVGQQLRA